MDGMDVEPAAKRPRLGSKSSMSSAGNAMDLDHHHYLSVVSLRGALPPVAGPNAGAHAQQQQQQQQNPHDIPVDNWACVMRYLAFPDVLVHLRPLGTFCAT